jgi:iron(III) transport system permease protein
VLVLLLLVGVPLAQPLVDLAQRGSAWQAWSDADRLLALARNTAAVVAGTLVLALPLGVSAAVLLYRTDLPLRGLFRFLTVLTVFVPLPVLTSAWQAALGSGGWLPAVLWSERAGQPWAAGLVPAVCVHAQAALPWVILIVGQGLCWVEGELEEDALLAAGPWCVLWHVTLPRCQAALVAAALWVALQTAGEMAVTEVFQVRTFAEEAYTQFNLGGEETLARAVATALPAVALTMLVLALMLPRLQRSLPPLQSALVPPRTFPLGRARWPCFLAVLLAALLLAGVPLATLLWKAGVHGVPPVWSAPHAGGQILTAMHLHSKILFWSLAASAVTGLVTASLALVLCWLAAESRWLQAIVLGVLAVAWSLPGPVAGFGLKGVILAGVEHWPHGLFAQLFYDGPSPLPVMWAHLARFLPYAAAVLWPVVRFLPPELRDAARVDGATPGRELWHVVRPLTVGPFLAAVLVVTALSLGEISSSKPAATPGSDTYLQVIFDRMHYGVTNEVAALCLLLLLVLALAGLEVAARGLALRGYARQRAPDTGLSEPEASATVARDRR